MNSVSGIFVALSIIFGGGYALDKILTMTKRAAVEHIHSGMPSLSAFTTRLTRSEISSAGTLVPVKCGARRASNR
jgi:hypothetical protein